jgi:hypothetical protein
MSLVACPKVALVVERNLLLGVLGHLLRGYDGIPTTPNLGDEDHSVWRSTVTGDLQNAAPHSDGRRFMEGWARRSDIEGDERYHAR